VVRAEPAGGSLQLLELIEEHGRAILYDLQAIGVDLRDLWRPGTGVTPRYVLSLVEQLPTDSAFAASLRGGLEMRGWDPKMFVLAAIVNLLNAANRQRAGKRTREPLLKPPSRRSTPTVVTVAELTKRPGALVAD
jgi:hypothetical protein